ncbi:hypothetical protein MC885_012964 [Smutsia gigantea]|nr:hypothetical protein MC885_012964 [Smutsia gigantea]
MPSHLLTTLSQPCPLRSAGTWVPLAPSPPWSARRPVSSKMHPGLQGNPTQALGQAWSFLLDVEKVKAEDKGNTRLVHKMSQASHKGRW